jgi:hypothetical protein
MKSKDSYYDPTTTLLHLSGGRHDCQQYHHFHLSLSTFLRHVNGPLLAIPKLSAGKSRRRRSHRAPALDQPAMIELARAALCFKAHTAATMTTIKAHSAVAAATNGIKPS